MKRLADKPFVLLGVNSDTDKDQLKRLWKRSTLPGGPFGTAPSEGTGGPISTKWNVHGWPTIYVVDAKGVIRFKNVRGEAMDKAVDQLLKEMEKGGK